MARSQFNFVVAVPDATTKALEVTSAATVKVRYRNPDPTVSTDYDDPAVVIYSSETGTSTITSNGTLTPDANGRVSGWLEDGRYRITVTSTDTPAAFSPIVENFDTRSGGEFKISSGGVPSSPANPQIFFDDDAGGDNPSIKMGSGSNVPDVKIQRTDTNELTLDSSTSGLLSTIIVGDVKLSGSSSVLDVNSSRIQNTASPLVSSDAATKGYVDASNSGSELGFDGRLHNMPLLTPTAGLTAASTNNVYFSRITPPLNINLTSIEFVRASGNNAVTFQFGIFAEYNDYSSIHKMICLAATKVETTTWNATSAKSYELPIGVYQNIDEDVDLEFVEQSFFYGDWILDSGYTGALYAGIITTGTNTVSLLGADVTSPILSETLGLAEERQFPIFAGTSSSPVTISSSSYYKGVDSTVDIKGSLANTSNLPEDAQAGDAYFIGDSLHVAYFEDNSLEWYAASTVSFPAARSTKVPFVRVKV